MTEIVKPKKKITWVEIILIIFFVVIITLILFPVFARAREKRPCRTCSSGQRQIAVSAMMYAQDHNEMLPAKETFWEDANLDPGVLVCPTMYDKVKNHYKSKINCYAYNTWVANKFVGKFPDPTLVFMTCDSDSADNLWYSPADTANRHSGQCIYSYADGHVANATDDISRSYMVLVDGHEIDSNNDNYYRPYLFNKTLNFPNTDPALNNFDFTSADLNYGMGPAWKLGPVNMFTIMWDGYIKVPSTGIYKFDCIADDYGSLEFIDMKTSKTTTVLNSVYKGNINGKIKLIAGRYYEFKLSFTELTGNASMTIRWTPPNGKQSRIPSSILCKGIEAITSN